MLNSQYFQPMQHKALPDVRKYALLSNSGADFYTVVKPQGIDVYIRNGQIFDFNHNELQSQYLKFQFERLLQTSINMQMIIVGVLVSDNSQSMLAHRYTIYMPSKAVYEGIKFLVYDIHFPVFNVDHDYKWRYDIAKHAIGTLPNCEILDNNIIKDEFQLQNITKDVFEKDINAEIIVYRTNGKYSPGESQLYWDDKDTVSYNIKATQRYRGHIKHVISTTYQYPNGNKESIAAYIVARYKKDFINIPISDSNLALRSYLWNYRKDLKNFPFWFTGYTYIDKLSSGMDYVTVVNEFLSFIPTSDAC